MNRTLRGLAVLLVAVLTALAATPAHADTDTDAATSKAAREPATVTVPVHTMDGLRAVTGRSGAVDVRIGRSRPIRVALDTGFTGLILFPSAWSSTPAGVSVQRKASTTKLADGSSVTGFPGKATLTISGVSTVDPVPFIFTKSDSAFFEDLRSTGVHGLMGVGLKGSNTLTNPLQSLPGELGLSWSMHYDMNATETSTRKGALVLGAAPPTSPTMAFDMPPNGTDVNGARLWDDHSVNACWTFGRQATQCVPTLFDSEFTVLRATGVSDRGLRRDADGDLRVGTPVKLAAPGAAFNGWSYRSGQRASVNRTQVFRAGKPSVIAGNMVFFDFTITYNTITGTLYLSDPVGKGPTS